MMIPEIRADQFPLFIGIEVDSIEQCCYCQQTIRLKALVFKISHGDVDNASFNEQSISFEIIKFQTNYKKGQAEN